MWQDDVCKVSMIQDENRQQAQQPTEYPIPKVYLYLYIKFNLCVNLYPINFTIAEQIFVNFSENHPVKPIINIDYFNS